MPGAVLDYDKVAVKRNDLIDKTGSSKQYSATYDDALKQIREMDNDLIYNVAKKLKNPYTNKVITTVEMANLSKDIINEFQRSGRIDKSTAKELTKYFAQEAGMRILSHIAASTIGVAFAANPVGAVVASAVVILFCANYLEKSIDGVDKWITSGQAEEYLQGVMEESMERYNKECAELRVVQERIARENEWHKYEEKVSAEATKKMNQDLVAAAVRAGNAANNAMASVANKNIGKMTPAEQKNFDDLVGLGLMSQQIANQSKK